MGTPPARSPRASRAWPARGGQALPGSWGALGCLPPAPGGGHWLPAGATALGGGRRWLPASAPALDGRRRLPASAPAPGRGRRRGRAAPDPARPRRGRGGEPRAPGHLAADLVVGAGNWDSRAQQLGCDAAHEGAPALVRRGVGKLELVELAQIERERGMLLRSRSRAHGDPLGDRERQRETAFESGVLSDQVHPSGGERAQLRVARAIALRSAAADSLGEGVHDERAPRPARSPRGTLSFSAVRRGG